MELNFCRRCGAKLTHVPNSPNAYLCEQGHHIFDNPDPVAGIFFVEPDNKHALVSVRGRDPHKGLLDAFGGFLDGKESSTEAAIRELREELSLEPGDYSDLQYLTSSAGEYFFSGENRYITATLYWSRLKESVELHPQDDVADIRRINIHEVDMAEIHSEEIREGIRALQRLFPKE